MPDLTVVPANEASWEDLEAIFGTRGAGATLVPAVQAAAEGGVLEVPGRGTSVPAPSADGLRAPRVRHHERTRRVPRRRARRLVRRRAEVRVRRPAARLQGSREGRDEDKTDDTVWAVTCFLIRAGYRKGLSYALARAAVDFARSGALVRSRRT